MANEHDVITGLPDDELAMQVVRRLRSGFRNKLRLPDDDARWLARQFAQIRAEERDRLCAPVGESRTVGRAANVT